MPDKDMLGADPNSVLVDGLPDLSKYIFIHSSIDDADLDPFEFRVFCHLRRRARDRVAYPGMRSISRVTKMSIGKVCRVIASLQKKGFLAVRQRQGNHQTNIYYVGLPAEAMQSNSVHVVNTSVHVVNERVSTEGTPSKKKNRYTLTGVPSGEKASLFPQALPKGGNKEGVMASKKDEHDGQLPLSGIQKSLRENQGPRPPGMPSLAMIQTETTKLGLPDSDAEYIFDAWLTSGFRLKNGNKIRDWKAAVRNWYRNNWFPSLRRKSAWAERDKEAEELARIRRAKERK
jgi:hypothetical protein